MAHYNCAQDTIFEEFKLFLQCNNIYYFPIKNDKKGCNLNIIFVSIKQYQG